MFSKLGIQSHTISSSILYMILIFVSIKAWMNLMDEQSAFEETTLENNKKLPAFTISPNGQKWPNQPDNNKSIESFEDVATAIKNVESKFTIQYSDYDRNFERPIPIVENCNNTLDSVWKFVPKISIRDPSEDAICLIWTPSKDRRPEKQIFVSSILGFCFRPPLRSDVCLFHLVYLSQ